ncbi:MAG: hypothetical protein ACI35S_06760 [Anaeroplasma sp.]
MSKKNESTLTFKSKLLLYKSLAADGKRLIEEAYNNRGFQNRSYNLHDSYISFVIDNGKVIDSTIRYITPELSRGEYQPYNWKGREMAQHFINTIKGISTYNTGIHLIVAATMPYAYPLQHLYNKAVIAIDSSVNTIAVKYNGSWDDFSLYVPKGK